MGQLPASRAPLVPLLALALACAGSAAGDATQPGPATVAATHHHRLASKHVDQVFSIDVWTPPSASGPLPVVYVLDGNGFFAMAAQTVGPMVFAGELPPLAVVGIGYEVSSVLDVVALRVRDLTPSFVPGFAEEMAARGMPLPDGVRPGGAAAFLRFIDGELKPFVASRYRVDASDQTLVGDSFGGLFAMYVAIHSPGSFARYVIGSPSLAWDGDRMFRDEREKARRSHEWPVKMFLSAGALEVDNGILDGVRRMSSTLDARGYEGLELTTHVFADETHHSVIGATISRGLRAVFGAPPE